MWKPLMLQSRPMAPALDSETTGRSNKLANFLLMRCQAFHLHRAYLFITFNPSDKNAGRWEDGRRHSLPTRLEPVPGGDGLADMQQPWVSAQQPREPGELPSPASLPSWVFLKMPMARSFRNPRLFRQQKPSTAAER